MPVDVSVIIVSYNARELLGKCLQAVAEQTASGLSIESVVVDNDSADDSVHYVRENWPEVRVVETGVNGGMAAGNNAGMQVARGRYLFLLNSDAFLEPGAIAALVRALDEEPRVGMAVPKLLNVDRTLQRSARSFPTTWRLATEFWYLRKLAPRSERLNGFYRPTFAHDRYSTDVDWYMGAAMMVRRETVDDVGLMDEVFFMYGEEVDWQQRMRAAGWKIAFVPDAQAVHLGGGSSRKAWGAMYQSQVANHVRYVSMHHGPRAGRRVRRMIGSALWTRALIYRALALLPGSGRQARAERARTFAAAGRSLRGVDPTALAGERRIPRWDGAATT